MFCAVYAPRAKCPRTLAHHQPFIFNLFLHNVKKKQTIFPFYFFAASQSRPCVFIHHYTKSRHDLVQSVIHSNGSNGCEEHAECMHCLVYPNTYLTPKYIFKCGYHAIDDDLYTIFECSFGCQTEIYFQFANNQLIADQSVLFPFCFVLLR